LQASGRRFDPDRLHHFLGIRKVKGIRLPSREGERGCLKS
jgi:hypothetical protein